MMNRSNFEHLILFMLATLFYKLGTPAWLYLGAAAILIELDQARKWIAQKRDDYPFGDESARETFPFWQWVYYWFRSKDTQFDLLMDALGMALIYVVFWVIGG